MLSPEQCRAARALLNWTQADLAERVSISFNYAWTEPAAARRRAR